MKIPKPGINFVTLVLVQVISVFVFLTLFFFTYAAKKEGEIVENQVKFLVNDIVENNLELLPEKAKQEILKSVQGIDPNTPENVKASAKIAESNEKIKQKSKKMLLIMSAAVVLFIVVSLFLKKKGINYFKDLELKHILKESAIVLFFIGLIELYFLNAYAANYVSVKPNIIKAQVCRNISKGFS